MNGIDAGRMDRRITLRALTVTRGAAGGLVDTYADLATVWTEKVSEASSEFRAAAALHGKTTSVFRIRYRSDLTTKHRLVYAGKTYEIVGDPTEEGRKEFLLVAAKYTEAAA